MNDICVLKRKINENVDIAYKLLQIESRNMILIGLSLSKNINKKIRGEITFPLRHIFY